MDRTKTIIRTGFMGVGGNVILCVIKALIGLLVNSISIVMDAVNDLTDALVSVITVIGAKLSVKEPDRKHPFGYGRVEYLSSLLIGICIIYAGMSAMIESVKRIISPQPHEYSVVSLMIIGIAILGKVVMGSYMKRVGIRVQSLPLISSGKDSLDDSIASTGTLIAGIIYMIKGFSIEAYVGVIIAILIIRTGVETLRDTVHTMLGERVSADLSAAVKKSIMTFPEVEAVFGLDIHNYGNDKLIGSVHIEVPDVLTAAWIDNLQRSITKKVLEDTGVEMRGVSIYAINTKHTKATDIQNNIRDFAKQYPDIIDICGFYLDEVDKEIKFDMVVDYDAKDKTALCELMREKIAKDFPGYEIDIKMDQDIAE